MTSFLFSLLLIPPSFAQNECSKIRPFGESSFTITSYLAFLRNRKDIDSVEKALCALPKSVRSNYVLMKNSTSAQHSRPTHPRAIMFDPNNGKDGDQPIKYVLSFNGHPGDRQYNSIEIAEVRPNSKDGLAFIDVEFSKGKGSHASQPNPEACMQCHRDGESRLPRFLWHAKGFTPSAYGQTSFGGIQVEDPNEVRQFQEFAAEAKSHPRYKQLMGLDEFAKDGAEKKKLEKLVEKNNIFASRLGYRNRNRVAQLIMETKDYPRYKYAILGALMSCEPIEDFIPEKIKAEHNDRQFIDADLRRHLEGKIDLLSTRDKIAAKLNSLSASSIEVLEKTLKSPSPERVFLADMQMKQAQWGQDAGEPIARLRWLIEGRGISMENWSMDVGANPGHYRFLNAPGIGSSPSEYWFLGQELLREDASLRRELNIPMKYDDPPLKYQDIMPFIERHIDCKTLKAKSLAKLAEPIPAQKQSTLPARK